MAVASWDEFPPSPREMRSGMKKADESDFAGRFTGTCLRCQVDMNGQMKAVAQALSKSCRPATELSSTSITRM